MNQLYCIK